MGKKETDKAPALGWFDTKPVELDPVPEDPAEAVMRRIEAFEDTLPARVHRWQKGDPAPDWMGPRPAWAEDHYDGGDRFCPNECFWQSYDLELPAGFMYGTKSQDKNFRTVGAYRVFLRQGMNERDPHIHIDMGKPWNRSDNPVSKFYLKLTLAEVDDLVAALEMLADIAKMGMADGAGGD